MSAMYNMQAILGLPFSYFSHYTMSLLAYSVPHLCSCNVAMQMKCERHVHHGWTILVYTRIAWQSHWDPAIHTFVWPRCAESIQKVRHVGQGAFHDLRNQCLDLLHLHPHTAHIKVYSHSICCMWINSALVKLCGSCTVSIEQNCVFGSKVYLTASDITAFFCASTFTCVRAFV